MNRSCYVVFISLVLDLLAFTIILPLMPSLLDYYESNDQTGWYDWLNHKVNSVRNYLSVPGEHNKVLFAGLIGSCFSFLQFLSSPFIGALSDAYGRRPTLIACFIGTIVSYVLWMASGGSFLVFIISRTIGGLSKGNISLSTAIITDLSTPAERTKGMALIGVSFSIGFIFGPSIGAYFSYLSKNSATSLSQDVFRLPATLATILATINLLFMYKAFKESLPKDKRMKSIGPSVSRALDLVNPVSLFNFKSVQNISTKDMKKLRKIGAIYFLYLFLYSGLEYTLTFLTHQRFLYTRMQQAKMFLFNGILMTILQGGYVRKVAIGNELKTVIQGLVLIIPSFVIIGLSSDTMQFYSALSLYAFASATVVPCLTTLASSLGPFDQKGTILGTFRSLGSLARAFGPLISAFGFWKYGAELCYCVGGLLLAIPLLLSYSLRKELHFQKVK